MNFKAIDSKIIFSGKVFKVKLDKIKYLNSGNIAPREVVIHNGGAVVLAVTEENKIILVKQFRYPFRKYLWELPAGKLDEDELPIDCARRELKEETGYEADSLIKLGSIYTSPGYSSEELHIFLATDLKPGKTDREEGEEDMKLAEASFEEFERMIRTGEIKDSKTISALQLYYLSEAKLTEA